MHNCAHKGTIRTAIICEAELNEQRDCEASITAIEGNSKNVIASSNYLRIHEHTDMILRTPKYPRDGFMGTDAQSAKRRERKVFSDRR